MRGYVKAWQNVHRGASGEIHDDRGLMALDALRFGRLHSDDKFDFELQVKMIEDFDEDNPDFKNAVKVIVIET